MAEITKDTFSLLNLISEFEGDKEKLHQFFFQCKKISELVHDNQKRQFLKLIVATKLTGPAMEYIRYKSIEYFDELKTELKKYCNVNATDWRLEIMLEFQKSSETVIEFGTRLLNKFLDGIENQLNYTSDNEVQILIKSNEKLLIDCFRRGLKDQEIKDALLPYKPLDFNDILTFTQKIENNISTDNLVSNLTKKQVNISYKKNFPVAHNTSQNHKHYSYRTDQPQSNKKQKRYHFNKNVEYDESEQINFNENRDSTLNYSRFNHTQNEEPYPSQGQNFSNFCNNGYRSNVKQNPENYDNNDKSMSKQNQNNFFPNNENHINYVKQNGDEICSNSKPENFIVLETNETNLEFVLFNFKNQNLINSVRLIVDTGAEISLIKCNKIGNNKIDTSEIKDLRGIANVPVFTLGTCTLTVVNEGEEVNVKFHVVSEEFPISKDGILGHNFLANHSAEVSYKTKILTTNNIRWKMYPPKTEFMCVPSRSEMFVKVNSNIKSGECMCFSQTLADNIILGSCLTKAINGKCIVSVVNVSEQDVTLQVPTIKLQKLDNSVVGAISLDNSNISTKNINERINEIRNNINTNHLNQEEKESLDEIYEEFADVFLIENEKLSHTNSVTHKIPLTPESGYVNVKPYRLPFTQRKVIEEHTNEMLKQGIIEKSTSPFNSPLLVVPKKSNDGSQKFRVVVDFRKLNNMTVDIAYPIPQITDILDQLGKSKYFTTLDLASGFHQIPMDPNDKEKTAFSTHQGHYHFNRMPFGLKGAPLTFQKLMDTVLIGLQGIHCFIYIDDLVIYATTLEEHNKKLKAILNRLRKHNLKLQPSKCNFLRKEVCYLGHLITDKGIKPNPENVKAVIDFKTPSKVKHVRAFLGLVGYYRRFIKNFSKIAEPLNNLLKKNVDFAWTPNCEIAFQFLKKLITEPPILQYPDFSKNFILTTDASNKALGAVLSQGAVGKDLPIAFASRTLSKAEQNYSTTEKELLAITWATKYFRPYLYGTKFTIVTDHKPLTHIFGIKDPGTRLTNLRLKLEEYNFNIIYKSGKNNTNADGLSRMYITTPSDTSYQEFLQSMKNNIIINNNIVDSNHPISSIPKTHTLVTFIPKQIHTLQNTNLEPFDNKFEISETLEANSSININDKLELEENTQKLICYIICETCNEHVDYEVIWNNINKLKEDCLTQNIQNISIINIQPKLKLKFDKIRPMLRFIFKDSNIKIFIHSDSVYSELTEEQKCQIIKEHHELPLGGHQGVNRTYKRIKEKYSWRKMKKEVTKFIKKCQSCQKNKILGRNTKMPLEITSTSSEPFEKIFLDIVGPLTTTESGNKYILTIQDDLTKFSDAIAIPNQEAETIAKVLVDNVICKHGTPQSVLHDQGTNFMSDIFKNLCRLLKIKKINCSAYHPESNGALERSHRTLAEYLRHFINNDQTNWDTFLKTAMFTYNTTPHSTTSYTPFELVYGHKASLPSNLKQEPILNYNYDDYLNDLKYKLQYSHKIAHENILNKKYNSKEQYDQRSNNQDFQVGDKVLLHDETVRRGRSKKLDPIWVGPYTIISKDSPVNYTINTGRRNLQVHANRLKHFYD